MAYNERTFLIGQRVLLVGLRVLQVVLIESGDALEDRLLGLLGSHICESGGLDFGVHGFGLSPTNNSQLTFGGGKNDLLLGASVLQFVLVESLLLIGTHTSMTRPCCACVCVSVCVPLSHRYRPTFLHMAIA